MTPLLGTILVYNLLVVVGFLLYAWGLRRNSLFPSRGFPPALRAAIRPLTPREKRTAGLLGAPLLAVMLLVPLCYQTWAAFTLNQGFLQNWWEGFLILFSFNLVDLVVIDWVLVCTLTPSFLVAPGTEGHPGYKDYWFHLRAALRGTLLVALLSLGMAAAVGGLAAVVR